MPRLYGREYTKTELLKRVGDISQVARVKPYRLSEGYEEGLAAFDVATGSGLEFTVLPGRGMDISAARFNGRSLAWRSAVGDKHAAFFEPEGLSWLRSFAGGLVTTCGYTWNGAPCVDEGKPLGLHGRANNTPATNVSWSGEWVDDTYELTVSGKMREAIVFGENVVHTRTIRARLGERKFVIEDHVHNQGFEPTPHMMLYHINIGYPLLDQGAKLVAPSIEVTPRDGEAEKGYGNYGEFEAPIHGYAEQCFFHKMRAASDGSVTTAIVNAELDGGTAVYVTYNTNQLPFFTEWKMVGEGTYVVGMEPANSLVLGRAAERQAGRLQFLQPGESRVYRLELGVACGAQELAALSA